MSAHTAMPHSSCEGITKAMLAAPLPTYPCLAKRLGLRLSQTEYVIDKRYRGILGWMLDQHGKWEIFGVGVLVADPEGALIWTRLQTPHSSNSVRLGDYSSADLCRLRLRSAAAGKQMRSSRQLIDRWLHD